MTLFELILLLIVAGIAGGIGQAIGGYTTGGCFVSIGLGLVGAVVGMYIARELNLPEFFVVHIGDKPFPIVWSILGSALCVAILGLISGRRR